MLPKLYIIKKLNQLKTKSYRIYNVGNRQVYTFSCIQKNILAY